VGIPGRSTHPVTPFRSNRSDRKAPFAGKVWRRRESNPRKIPASSGSRSNRNWFRCRRDRQGSPGVHLEGALWVVHSPRLLSGWCRSAAQVPGEQEPAPPLVRVVRREQVEHGDRPAELALEPPHDVEQALERGDPRRAPRDPDPSVDQLGCDLVGQVAREREAVRVVSRCRPRRGQRAPTSARTR